MSETEVEFRFHAQFTVENLAGWNADTEVAKTLFKDAGTLEEEIAEGPVRGAVPVLIRQPWWHFTTRNASQKR